LRARLQRPRSLARALDSAALDSCSDRRRSDRRHSNQRRSDRRLSVLGHFSLARNANALNDTITEDSSRTAERARTAQGCSSPLRHTRLGMRQEHSRAHSSTGGSSGQSRCRQAAACSHQRPTGRSCRKWRCTCTGRAKSAEEYGAIRRRVGDGGVFCIGAVQLSRLKAIVPSRPAASPGPAL